MSARYKLHLVAQFVGIRAIGSLQEAARAGRWKSAQRPGKWVKVTRTFRDGSSQDWWALEVVTGPYGPDKPERVVIATTDPLTLPDLTTFYLVTNLPAPGSQRAQESLLAVASLEEVVRLYGLHMWVEQSYKQVKHALGWSQYQVRSDRAMRRHWQLVCCAFSFCWYHASHAAVSTAHKPLEASEPPVVLQSGVPADGAGTGKKNQRGKRSSTAGVLADGVAGGTRMVGALDHGSRATGTAGLNCPHLLRCSSFSDGLNEDTPLLSIVQLDPRPQTTVTAVWKGLRSYFELIA